MTPNSGMQRTRNQQFSQIQSFLHAADAGRYAVISNMENTPRLMVELVWEYADLEELAIVADNGHYRGVATVYFGRWRCWSYGKRSPRVSEINFAA